MSFEPGDILQVNESMIAYREPKIFGDRFYINPGEVLTVLSKRQGINIKVLRDDLGWYKCLMTDGCVVWIMAADYSVELITSGKDPSINIVPYK